MKYLIYVALIYVLLVTVFVKVKINISKENKVKSEEILKKEKIVDEYTLKSGQVWWNVYNTPSFSKPFVTKKTIISVNNDIVTYATDKGDTLSSNIEQFKINSILMEY